MDYGYNRFENQSYDQDLAFDLRTFYARLVGSYLDAIRISKMIKDYPNWFRNLIVIYPVIAHKIKKYDEHLVKEKIKSDDYSTIMKQCLEVINKYNSAYLKRSADPKAIGEIEEKLLAVEEYYFSAMDNANMFGSHKKLPGL